MQRFELDDARIPLNGSGYHDLKKKSDFILSGKSVASAEQKLYIDDLLDSHVQKNDKV